MRRGTLLGICLGLLTVVGQGAYARDLEVGEGKAFLSIEAAYKEAQPGDTILIHPLPEGRTYNKVALFVSKPRITFRGVPVLLSTTSRLLPILSGKGVNYTGVGQVPRAVLQFNASANECVVDNLEISGAHNDSHNGAAIRINEANQVAILNCDLHHNDMGIMSNGEVARNTGADTLIERCHIHHNGDTTDPGYNHNLYMGGTSVVITDCEIDHSVTGHNYKSRAHFNWISHCFIHDAANREVDLVDDKDNTTLPDSDTVIVGCIIVKAKEMQGNKTVIHWGQDGGNDHKGTLHLNHNTIVTPYISPVVDANAASTKTDMCYNLLIDGGNFQNGQVLVQLSSGAEWESVTGIGNVAASGFGEEKQCRQTQTTLLPKNTNIPFRQPSKGDYYIKERAMQDGLKIPSPSLAHRLPLLPPSFTPRRKMLLGEGTHRTGFYSGFYSNLVGAVSTYFFID